MPHHDHAFRWIRAVFASKPFSLELPFAVDVPQESERPETPASSDDELAPDTVRSEWIFADLVA